MRQSPGKIVYEMNSNLLNGMLNPAQLNSDLPQVFAYQFLLNVTSLSAIY